MTRRVRMHVARHRWGDDDSAGWRTSAEFPQALLQAVKAQYPRLVRHRLHGVDADGASAFVFYTEKHDRFGRPMVDVAAVELPFDISASPANMAAVQAALQAAPVSACEIMVAFPANAGVRAAPQQRWPWARWLLAGTVVVALGGALFAGWLLRPPISPPAAEPPYIPAAFNAFASDWNDGLRELEPYHLDSAFSLPQDNATVLIERLNKFLLIASKPIPAGIMMDLQAFAKDDGHPLHAFLRQRADIRRNGASCTARDEGSARIEQDCPFSARLNDAQLRAVVGNLFGPDTSVPQAALRAAQAQDVCVFLVAHGTHPEYQSCRVEISARYQNDADWFLSTALTDSSITQ